MIRHPEKRHRRVTEQLRLLWLPWVFLCSILLPSTIFAEGFTVLTTIFPFKEFAQAVGGERVKVTLLLPPGAEPHTWEPKPSDMVKISRAGVFLYVGAEMEPWVPGILRSINNATLTIIEASQGFPLIATGSVEHNHDEAESKKMAHKSFDPHVWLNFEYDQKIVDKIVTVLTKKDPGGAEYYLRNGESYKEKLKTLDLAYTSALKNCAGKEFILGSHAAFAYLAQRYGLKQISLYGVSPNAEPTPKKMAEVVRMAKQYRVRAIYYEELVSDKLAKAIANEVGAKTLILNPGHNLKKNQIEEGITFLSLMEKNLENLTYGLGCQ
ncbi:MAG: zinc ABC transporter substrate-binding protein [Pseudomonadota bacterium]